MAVAVGVRAASWATPVPSRTRSVAAAISTRGENASDPQGLSGPGRVEPGPLGGSGQLHQTVGHPPAPVAQREPQLHTGTLIQRPSGPTAAQPGDSEGVERGRGPSGP